MSLMGTATQARGSWKGRLTCHKCGAESPEFSGRLMWHEEFDETLLYGDAPKGWLDLTDPGDERQTGLCPACRRRAEAPFVAGIRT